jgi:ribosome-binding factor A
MSHRIEKINDLIRDSIAEILVKHLSFKKGVFVSVTKVDTSKDLRYARVLVSVFPENQQSYAIATLKNELFSIQSQLNKRVNSKSVPKIEFIMDKTQHNVDEIENIFKQIHEEHEEE